MYIFAVLWIYLLLINKMVEGPQNAYMARRISKRFKNKRLHDVKVVGGRYKTHQLKNLKLFKMSLPLRLKGVYNKGKVLFLFFENKDGEAWTMIVKFGMSAWFYFGDEDENVKPDIEFMFDKVGKLNFHDTRHFGTITVTKDADLIMRELEKIAPDVLDKKVNYSEVKDRIKEMNPNATIDTILMDQSAFVSGIGNIIKSEVLYDAKISPKTRVKDLDQKQWKRLFQSAKKITQKVLSEIISGAANEFEKITKIYQMDQDPKGNKVERFTSPDGRVTFWVPNIQTI
jgi:DNA-formamidopyrimidine glycosylase